MTVLSLIQTCAARLQLQSPSVVVTSSDGNIKLLKAMMEQAAQELRNEYRWPELQREHTFTLATSTASYALPGDFDRFVFETLWNRTQTWPLLGPLDAVEWQHYKSGLITSFPDNRFRVKYWGIKQFFIDPTPTSDANGQTCAYEYITRSVFRPKTWAASTSFAASSYCSYDGNIYQTSAGGTTGSTAPTHTSGSTSDGGVTWTYISTAYESIIADTDECLLDNQMIIDGTVWRYKRECGLDYQELRADAEKLIEIAKTKLSSAGILSISNASKLPWMIGPWSYPEGNFGL